MLLSITMMAASYTVIENILTSYNIMELFGWRD